jgi:hypothetical protein
MGWRCIVSSTNRRTRMKMAQGYVTDDGTFFESKMEAELHEAESLFRGNLAAEFPQLDADKLIAIVYQVMPTLKGYIDAHYAAAAAKRDQQAEEPDRGKVDESKPPEVDAGIGHVSSTEEDLASLLKLPTRGPSHVPDVGGSPRSKKVQERRAKHGA